LPTPHSELARPIWEAAQVGLPRWLRALQRARGNRRAALIPCIRDIWHDHVLYDGPTISGVVDFGSLDYDAPATDVARLVGSLVADDPSRRRLAIESYQAHQTRFAVNAAEVDLLDRSGILIAGLNWIEWLWIERRTFEAMDRVQSRLAEIATRLQDKAFWAADG
jgi:Ser/Thr protein kinase RdoA (MazF antagonist)